MGYGYTNLYVTASTESTLYLNVPGKSVALVNSTNLSLIHGNTYILYYENSSNDLYFQTNASDRMVIKGGGNVGIGTTSPLAKLQVGVSSALTNYQGAPLGLMLPDGGGSWVEFAENTTNGTSFRISHAASSETIMMNANVRAIGFRAASYAIEAADAQMILTTGGNVGINNTSP
jgi:hypothetical protein